MSLDIEILLNEKYKSNENDLEICYGYHKTPYGRCLIAITKNNEAIVSLAFVTGEDKDVLEMLKLDWSLSKITEGSKETEKIIDKIFNENNKETIKVLLKGTQFQTDVLKALTSIPPGTVTTYDKIGEVVGKPKAIRAIASTVSKNPIAYLIPCHRIAAKTGFSKTCPRTTYRQNILSKEDQNK